MLQAEQRPHRDGNRSQKRPPSSNRVLPSFAHLAEHGITAAFETGEKSMAARSERCSSYVDRKSG